MIIGMISYRCYKRFLKINTTCSHYLNAYSLVISIGRTGLRGSSNNQVIAVLGLTLLATSLSALFASFILGIFQGSVSQTGVDVRVIRISKISSLDNGDGVWDLMLNIYNNGGSILEISYIDLVIGYDSIAPSKPSDTGSAMPRIMPGEQKILKIVITNGKAAHSVDSNVIVFSDERLNSGVMVSLRIIDSGGHIVLIPFTLP